MDHTMYRRATRGMLLASVACLLPMAGCHTVHGVGEDVAGVGNVIGDTISGTASETHQAVFTPDEPLYPEE